MAFPTPGQIADAVVGLLRADPTTQQYNWLSAYLVTFDITSASRVNVRDPDGYVYSRRWALDPKFIGGQQTPFQNPNLSAWKGHTWVRVVVVQRNRDDVVLATQAAEALSGEVQRVLVAGTVGGPDPQKLITPAAPLGLTLGIDKIDIIGDALPDGTAWVEHDLEYRWIANAVK